MFQLHKGNTRRVLVIGPIAFKFARFSPKVAFNNSRLMGVREAWGYKYWQLGGTKNCLFRGIISNWLEFVFYLKHKHPFLIPTYFSLFGLVNIQPAREKAPITMNQLWVTLHKMTNGAVEKDDHVFAGRTNFCNDNGKLRMMDYGSRKTQEVLLEWADKIYSEFQFPQTT